MIKMLQLLVGEIRRRVLLALSYKVSWLTSLVLFYVGFLALIFFFDQIAGGYEKSDQIMTAVGYLTWFCASGIIVGISEAILEEARNGTLEQIYLSPAPPAFIFFGWSVGEFLISGLATLVMGTALVLTFRLGVRLTPCLLPLFLLTLVGVYGFAYLLGGLSLIFKQLGDLPGFVANILIFLTGAIVPVEGFPYLFRLVAYALPTTQGISLMRAVLIEGKGWAELLAEGRLPGLVAHSAIYLALGLLAFTWCERIARQQGSLGHY